MYEASPPATTPHTLSSFTTAFPRTTHPIRPIPHAHTEIPRSRTRHGEAPRLHERRHRPPGPRPVERPAFPERPASRRSHLPTPHRHADGRPRGGPTRPRRHRRGPHDPHGPLDDLGGPAPQSTTNRPPRPWATSSRRAGPDTGVRAPHSCCWLGNPHNPDARLPGRDTPPTRHGHRAARPRGRDHTGPRHGDAGFPSLTSGTGTGGVPVGTRSRGTAEPAGHGLTQPLATLAASRLPGFGNVVSALLRPQPRAIAPLGDAASGVPRSVERPCPGGVQKRSPAEGNTPPGYTHRVIPSPDFPAPQQVYRPNISTATEQTAHHKNPAPTPPARPATQRPTTGSAV